MSSNPGFGEVGHEEHGGFVVGDFLSLETLEHLRDHLAPEESDKAFLYNMRPEFDRGQIAEKMDRLLAGANYQPAHSHWKLVKAVGNFVVRKGDKLKYYDETLADAEKRSGRPEAATFGTAEFGDEKCVVFSMNWGFLGGSVGEVVGEKFIEAAKLAREKKLPFVSFYTSGGMRQHENAYALAQMTRGVWAINQYLEETDTPHIAVLFGQVWGGTSASTVPLADTVIGVAGSDFGFAGPRVIENFQGEPVPTGSQSVEANYLERTVDVVVPYENLHEYIGKYLKIGKSKVKVPKNEQIPSAVQEEIWTLKHPSGKPRRIILGKPGLAIPLPPKINEEGQIYDLPLPRAVEQQASIEETLLANYQRLATDAGRPDGDFLIHSVFDNAVQLYTHYRRGNRVIFPTVIGAIARIGAQPFMVVANQPSYELRSSGSIGKLLATPRPQDYQHFVKLMEIARRREMPVVTFTDTMGAAPTIESEIRGQSEWIARSILAASKHPYPIMSIVTGALGSGGGLATTALAPRLMALDDAMIYVAEPSSAASIVYSTANPSRDQVQETLAGMDASAETLFKLGFIKRLIHNDIDPTQTAHNIREVIISEYADLSHKSPRQLSRLGKRAIENIRRGQITNR